MSTKATQKIAEGLLQAIQAENHGHYFYMMAAKTTEDPKGREVFEQLAQEELEHYTYLKRQYQAVLDTGQLNRQLRLSARKELTGPNPIFSEAIRDRIQGAHYEMTALSVAIQLELSASRFYAAQSEAATDPEVKQFFDELSAWETGHYEALLTQHESMQQDYWHENGFAPF